MPVVYRGRVFSVEVDRHRFPDGREHEVAIVRHPPSVVVIPMQDDGRVVLIRQYRASVAQVMWEVPAGSVDAGETPEQAARRECEEEIGLVPARIERVRGLYPTPGFCDEELIFFRASGLQAPPPDSTHAPDEDEDIQPQAFTVDEARAMVDRGEIVDLKTAYALTLIV
ncbi:MAG: NUDIX hydrolase [Vicinamibacterales bacterium]